MAGTEIENMALFCDFENVALGVREANLPDFDVRKVIERLLLKGSIVVKKAYSDWKRYESFKADMHRAAFELIEIPHRGASGKNSADIRMVVDALDLCYTKAHVDCFVIISGDSDFSPLVSKLRENDKVVIGVGVRNSTSEMLMENCDEFIFYDDLVKEEQRKEQNKREQQQKKPAPARAAKESAPGAAPAAPSRRQAKADGNVKVLSEAEEAQRHEGIQLVVDTVEALAAERGSEDRLWAGLVKEAVKRRRPGFRESAYGFSTFGKLLEAAGKRGVLAPDRDEKTGNLFVRPVPRED